jgi:hypothetical protein
VPQVPAPPKVVDDNRTFVWTQTLPVGTLASQGTVPPGQDGLGLPQAHAAGEVVQGWSCAVFRFAAVIAELTAFTAFCTGEYVAEVHVAQIGATAARAPSRAACVIVP